MIKNHINARIIKICSMGLTKDHLGKSIQELRDHFNLLNHKFGFNVCGEGGEYESTVFDCPLFKTHKIVSKNEDIVIHEDNEV
jgi:diphthine-ammonia ligase